MKKASSILEKIAEALAKVGDNTLGAHYTAYRLK